MKPRDSIVYKRCKTLIDVLTDLGYEKISWHDLTYFIKRHVGGDPRTLNKYREALVDFGFLEPVKGTLRNPIFRILEMPRPRQVKLTELAEENK